MAIIYRNLQEQVEKNMEDIDELQEQVDNGYYTKTEIDNKLNLKADKSDTYTKQEIDTEGMRIYTYIDQVDTSLNTRTSHLEDRTLDLENDVENLKSVQNVVDIVPTYSALQSYDTSDLGTNDKIQVIADESHDSASTIYNWDGTQWQYVGAFGGNSYTKAETYNKTQIDSALKDKADKSNTYTRAVIDSMILTLSTDKADKSDTYTKTEIDNTMQEVGQMFEIVGNEVLKKADKTELNNAINDLRWELGSHTLDVTTDSDTSFSKSVPSGAIGCQINQLGGMSYKSENLFNKSTANIGKALSTTNGTLYDSSNDMVSDYIEVIPNTQYSNNVPNVQFNICYYDENKTFISGETKTTPYTIPTNAHYLRIQALKTRLDTFMIVSGSTAPTKYQPYFEGIRDSVVTSVVSKGENLIGLNDETTSYYKISNGEITSLDTNSHTIELKNPITLIANNTYSFNRFMGYAQLNVALLDENSNTVFNGTWGTITASITPESDTIVKYIKWNVTSSAIGTIFKPMLVKGSTAPTEYKPYVNPIIKPIPSEIQALTGYGWGINNTCYNYIDFDRKVFVQKVGRVYLGSLEWNYNSNFGQNPAFYCPDSIGAKTTQASATFNGLCSIYDTTSRDYVYGNITNKKICLSGSYLVTVVDRDYNNPHDFKSAISGVYLYYELETPVETDISAYLTTDTLEVEPNGTLEFLNTYSQDVPSDIDYLIEEVKA